MLKLLPSGYYTGDHITNWSSEKVLHFTSVVFSKSSIKKQVREILLEREDLLFTHQYDQMLHADMQDSFCLIRSHDMPTLCPHLARKSRIFSRHLKQQHGERQQEAGSSSVWYLPDSGWSLHSAMKA